MGKRSNFERVERDFYPTPAEAVAPLLPRLRPGMRFAEPCAGNGALIDHLEAAGHRCVAAWDIEPLRDGIERHDALTRMCGNVDVFITNPPWKREVLHPLIVHLAHQAPTWLLFDADWMHTSQSAPYMTLLCEVVSVGRVKWIAGSKSTGKDNCAWHLFDARPPEYPARFYGRNAK